ncbi:hypothetical protein B0T11DRAFT_323501 [Plectosphaerella cucumerina]|uniref:Uncharacterized protein n=1 Tax=Plectosphaerella cucumerina TaxID=40658 RepID=A0A8K0X9X9_9PEZI|nr:hypothetical protein B0T11DRAFT_323501 [Plectosphaerella cucumerina]
MDASEDDSTILAWLDNIDPSADPDGPLISNLAPQEPGADNTGRLRGAPAPYPPLDTTVSDSIEELTVRRGMESPPALKLNEIRRSFKPVITIPNQSSSESLPVGASAGNAPSPNNDTAPSGGAALNCREIRPDDFLRDPRQTFAPRTEAQNQARRERFITQMHLEVDENVTDVDTLHAFMRHSLLAIPPRSKYHECKCPGGATISIMDRSAANDETPIPDEDEVPGNGTESNRSDRFALTDDEEDEPVGRTGRPISRGVEVQPIHPDSGLAILTHIMAQGQTDTLLEDLEDQTPFKYTMYSIHSQTGTSERMTGYIPIWMEGVSPSDSPWNSPLSGSPLLRPWTDYEQVPIFSERTPPAGSDPAPDAGSERDLGDGLTGEEYEMDELDLGDATLGSQMDGGSENAPRPGIKSRFTEDLPESNPNYRHSTDDDTRPLVEETALRCDMEQGVGHRGGEKTGYSGLRTSVLVVIALALMACVVLLVFIAVRMTNGF